jgi:hypothetical protein
MRASETGDSAQELEATVAAARFAGWAPNKHSTQGFARKASLHPRLYAFTRSRGLVVSFAFDRLKRPRSER